MRNWYRSGLAGLSIAVLAACSSPDDARDELRPDEPVDIALDQLLWSKSREPLTRSSQFCSAKWRG